MRKVFQAPHRPADEYVAHVLALQEGGYLQSVRQHRRHVLGRMDREIDAVVEKRLFQLLGEETLAAGIRKRAILDAVAAGGDHHDLEGVFMQAMGGHQARARLRSLGERQGATARSYSNHIGLHATASVITPIRVGCQP